LFADGTRLSASGHILGAQTRSFALLLPPKGARAHAKLRAKAAIEVRYIAKAAVEHNVEHTTSATDQPAPRARTRAAVPPGVPSAARRFTACSSIAAFRADQKALADVIGQADLYGRTRPGAHSVLLDDLLMIADHNAYHLGELILLRRLLGAWT
jgi:hypothetical protein